MWHTPTFFKLISNFMKLIFSCCFEFYDVPYVHADFYDEPYADADDADGHDGPCVEADGDAGPHIDSDNNNEPMPMQPAMIRPIQIINGVQQTPMGGEENEGD